MKKQKVLVGMSGGVDSSVTACLLKEQGYEVIGIHLKFWVDPTVFSEEENQKFPQNKCCTLEGLARTRQIAARLGIPFYVLNFEEIFKEQVVDFFIQGYAQGITPNPCIECNRTVKFGLFLQKMEELGADFIATGHYARIKKIETGATATTRTKADASADPKFHYELHTAKDTAKDQSYFLYTLTQEKLKHILFPIGDYTKTEVRQLAEKFGIKEVNQQKESQNLCFFPESKHGPFLQRYLKKHAFEHGPILTTAGQQVGTHQGLPNYTIGQRKGLGIGGIKGMENEEGNPWYVIRIDRARNALIVGRDTELFSSTFKAHTLNFIDEEHMRKNFTEPKKLQAKIRYRFPAQDAEVSLQIDSANPDQSSALIKFSRPQRAITPGQSVVFYDGDKVLGGGIIE